MTKTLLSAAALLPLLAACMQNRPDGAPTPPAGECRAEAAQGLIGRDFAPALSEEARRATGARTVRVVRPGEAVTMDFRPDRLNVQLDEANRVRTITCG